MAQRTRPQRPKRSRCRSAIPLSSGPLMSSAGGQWKSSMMPPASTVISGTSPVLIDRYLQNAIEVDIDAVSDGEQTKVVGIMEHIEEAGIHSGDSACSLPPYSLDRTTIDELERQTRELALGLDVVGLMNVQYAI